MYLYLSFDSTGVRMLAAVKWGKSDTIVRITLPYLPVPCAPTRASMSPRHELDLARPDLTMDEVG